MAPAIKRSVQISSSGVKTGEEEEAVEDEARCAAGRQALARFVTLVADATERPKPVHGVQVPADAIRSKFWA